YLHERLLGHASGYQVFGDVARGVGRRAVHLARVFARKRATAVRALAAVGVHDDFAAREARVAVRAANDELARGVDVVRDAIGKQRLNLGAQHGLYPRDEDGDDVLFDAGQHYFFRSVEVVVLRADNDGFDGLGVVVVGVANGYLAFGVGAQVSHLLPKLADNRQLLQQAVRQVERQRHIVICFVGGIAKHHALVAGTLLFGGLAHHALVDVGRLLVQAVHHLAGVGVEEIFGLVVADAPDGVADNGLSLYVRSRLDFAGHERKIRRHEGFAGYFGTGRPISWEEPLSRTPAPPAGPANR
nr:hypothetical protein [Tanacetum cinerariifolium]